LHFPWRRWSTVLLLAVAALLPAHHLLGAQSQATSIRYRAWVGGGVGAAANSGRTAVEWESWISRGSLGLGYQGSTTDPFARTTESAHGLLIGAILPRRRILGRAAAGAVSAKRCSKEGEEARNETCTSKAAPEFSISLDGLLGPSFAIHTSYFRIPSGSVGHSGFVFGVLVGRLGR
jgi:hypothetical protein